MLLLVTPSFRPFNFKKHFFGFTAGLSSYDETNLITLCGCCHAIIHRLDINFYSLVNKKRMYILQAEGIANAKARGVKLGAPIKVNEEQREKIIELCKVKKHDKKAIAIQFGISVPLIYKILAAG